MIVPIIPSLSKIKILPIMKSKITISYDGEKLRAEEWELHPLDLPLKKEILTKE